MALIVVGHRPATAALHRQPRLGTVEGPCSRQGQALDRRLLVNREHQRVLGRIDIEADDILDFGGEFWVVRQLEGVHPVRLQPMCRPDPLHAAMTDPSSLRHRPAGPVRRLTRRLSQRHLDHPFDRCRRQRRLATRTRRLVQQSVNPLGQEARLPAPDRRLAFAGLPLNLHGADRGRAQQDDPRPPRMLLRAVARCDNRFQVRRECPGAIANSKPNFNPFSHLRSFAHPPAPRNHSSVPIH